MKQKEIKAALTLNEEDQKNLEVLRNRFGPTRDVYFCDWKRGQVNVLKNDQPVKLRSNAEQDTAFSLNDLMGGITAPSIIVLETTFESFVLSQRAAVIDRASRDGHILLTVQNRRTARERGRMGMSLDDKSDAVDVATIRKIALNGRTHLKVPRKTSDGDRELDRKRTEICRELVTLRNTVIRIPSPRGGYLKKQSCAKEKIGEELAAILPPYNALDETFKRALGDGKQYSTVLLPTIAQAAIHTETRDEFEKLVGLYEHGYRSMLRSEIYHHSWRPAEKRGATMSEFRRSVRWLWRTFKTLGF